MSHVIKTYPLFFSKQSKQNNRNFDLIICFYILKTSFLSFKFARVKADPLIKNNTHRMFEKANISYVNFKIYSVNWTKIA